MRFALILATVAFSGCAEIVGSYERDQQMQAMAARNEQRRVEAAEKRRLQADADAQRERQREAARAEEGKVEAEVTENAKKRGFVGVDFKHGLVGVLGIVERGEIDVDAVGLVLIYLAELDDFPSTETIVWLKGYKKDGGKTTWLEGSKLRGRDFNYVIVKGVKTYGTSIGSRQAIVIEADL